MEVYIDTTFWRECKDIVDKMLILPAVVRSILNLWIIHSLDRQSNPINTSECPNEMIMMCSDELRVFFKVSMIVREGNLCFG